MTHKRITLENDVLLHVQTPLGDIYIGTGLSDHGRNMETIAVRPDHQKGVEKEMGIGNLWLVQEKAA